MKNITFIIVLLISSIVYSQNARNNIWYFGNNAGIDFNSGTPVVITNSSMNAIEGCATLCDEFGNLLMYSNGENIWNRNHNIMVNGGGLNGSHSASQSGLILPNPAQNLECYVFTVDFEGNSLGLQYSIADMSLQGGLGQVTSKNISLVSPVTEMITATRHANGTDVWVVAHKWNSNEFYSYLVTPTGIQPPVITSIGEVFTGVGGYAVGQMKFTTEGDKLGIINRNTQHIQLFFFNKYTGVFSNVQTITGITHNEYGLEFDISGRFIYYSRYNGISSGAEIFQYDVYAANITASEILIGTTPDYQVGSLQIAPNGKIYLARNGSNYIGVINNPNIQGLACNFTANGIYLSSAQSNWGLPSQIQIDLNTNTINNVTICEGDSAFLENSYQHTSGSYYDTLASSQGVDSILETILTINVINLDLGNDTTICNGTTINLDAGIFQNYLWSTGASTQIINVYSSGIYSVTVTDTLGCNESDTISVIVDNCININSRETSKDLILFPNPVYNDYINLKSDNKINKVVICDIRGKIIWKKGYKEKEIKINLKSLSQGLYSVTIIGDDFIKIHKFVKY